MLVDTADSSDRKSVILNIGSFVVHGMGWKGAYSASKAAFGVMSDVLRIEMENLGVRVITCETGRSTSCIIR
jgi:1-acylglycerone phosphate reductase